MPHLPDAGMPTPTPPPSPSSARSRYPTQVGGYRLLDMLGEGGMGAVFVGEPAGGGPRVAVKLIRPELAGDDTVRARFRREAWAQSQVAHPHIVPILTIDEAAGIPFIAMPLLTGQTLDARLAAEPVLPLALALRIGWEVADGLAAAYAVRKLIHRDIKPSNIWLETDAAGQFRRALILDFGLARPESGNTHLLTAGGAVIGTPGYMSPERVNGETVDHRADLFSLGVMLYLMATGKQPFGAPTAWSALAKVLTFIPPPVREVNEDIPGRLSDLIGRLMEKDPNDRPAAAAEVADELRAVGRLLGVSTQVFDPATAPPASTPAPSRPTVTPKEETDEWRQTDGVPPPNRPTVSPTPTASDSEVLLVGERPGSADPTPPPPPPPPPEPALTVQPSRPAGQWKEPPVPPRRRPVFAVAAVVAVLAAGALAVAFWPKPPVTQGTKLEIHTPPTPPTPPVPVPAPTLDLLDSARVPTDERWTGAPPELVAVVGSRVRQHFGGVGLILADPRDRWVATTDADETAGRVRLWNPHDLTPAGELAWDGGPPKWLAVSPDGDRLAAVDGAGQVCVFDVSRPDAQPELTPRIRQPAARLAFLADGRLVTATATGRLTAWDVTAAPREKGESRPPPGGQFVGEVTGLVAAPDGRRVAVWSDEDKARVVDLSDETPKLAGTLDRADQVAFGPDGRTVYTLERTDTGRGSRVRCWKVDGKQATPAGEVAQFGDRVFYRLAVSAAGELAVSTRGGGVLRYRHAPGDAAGQSLSAVDPRDAGGQAVQLAYGRRGTLPLYTGGAVLRAWDVGGPAPVEIAPFDLKGRVVGAVLAGGALVAAHADGYLRRWDLTGPVPSLAYMAPFAGGGGAITLAAPADARTAVRPADGGSPGVLVHRLDGTAVEPVRLATAGAVGDVGVSADGRWVAAAGPVLTVWERTADRYEPRAAKPGTGGWSRCAVSADGRWVAGWDRAFGLKVFAVAGDCPQVFDARAPAGATGAPVFSADGTWLAVVGTAPSLWRLADDKWAERKFPGDANRRPVAATFLPGRGFLVTCAERPDRRGYQLDVFDPEAGGAARAAVPLPGRADRLSAAADGRHVAAALENGTVIVVRLFAR